VVLEERAQVLAGGLEVLFGQPDHERLGKLKEAAAFSPVVGGDPGTLGDWFQRNVALEIERPGGALGSDLLVLKFRR
jgi:hypothetical protein